MPCDGPQGIPKLFIFKVKEENKFNSLYIEENATIRLLRKKIGLFYHKYPDSVILITGEVKYDRFDDEICVDTIKSFIILIEFDDIQDLGIESYLNDSEPLQE